MLIELLISVLYLANMIIISLLLLVYWRNYRKYDSSFALGLTLFAIFLLLHNLIEILSVIFFNEATQNVNLTLEYMYLLIPLIEFIGLSILLKVTWK